MLLVFFYHIYLSLIKGKYEVFFQKLNEKVPLTTFAADFVTPIIAEKQIDAFIAGNDTEAVDTVSALVSTAGFNPIVPGGLHLSRTLENMQLLLIQLGMKYNYNWLAGKLSTCSQRSVLRTIDPNILFKIIRMAA
jgi:hypothetical protein